MSQKYMSQKWITFNLTFETRQGYLGGHLLQMPEYALQLENGGI